MTIRKYLSSAALEASAMIETMGYDERGTWLRLDETIFHPQGGGQPADRGTINGVSVVFVVSAGEFAKHYIEAGDPLAAFAAGQTVHLCVDAAVRERHARLHTGGHLIAALVESTHPDCVAVAGHHWPGEARVEFESLSLADKDAFMAQLQGGVDQAVAADLPVAVSDTAGRLVAIGRYQAVPCGGTHCRSLAALAGLHITGTKTKSTRTRVSYGFDG
ncbi:MAG: hypothetical protein ACREVI_04090 [Steroidobacteraceae bacterium]